MHYIIGLLKSYASFVRKTLKLKMYSLFTENDVWLLWSPFTLIVLKQVASVLFHKETKA